MIERTTGQSAFRAATESAIVSDLAAFAAIRIENEDAREFLQNQLSSDVYALSPGDSQWSSYNSPRGRMLASLRLWRDPDTRSADGFGALIASDLAASTVKRLSMFVLRAKARVSDQSGTHAAIGVGGPRAAEVIATSFGVSPSRDGAIAYGDATVVGLGGERFIIVAPAARAAALRGDIVKVAFPADERVWRWLSITAGVPLITAMTADQFVPQMLNWDVLGGINFQKGCYPGQEIVARMRYLGRLKERLYGFHVAAESEPQPGMRLYGSAFGATPCGTVINAARAPDGSCALLAVVQISAVDAGALMLGAETGPHLTRVALPYSVPENESPRGRLA